MKDNDKISKLKIIFFTTFIISIPYFWFSLSYFTFEIFGRELRSDSFDSLGRSLLSLKANVDPQTINWEGFDIKGKKFMYFGPFPALLRIPLNLLFSSHYGEWARISCLLGAFISCFLGVLILIQHHPDYKLNKISKSFILNLLVFTIGFTFASPITFLVCTGRIYHESIIWGLAGSMGSVLFALKYLQNIHLKEQNLIIFGLACSTSVALLSRVTFGIPGLFVLAIVVINYFEKHNLFQVTRSNVKERIQNLLSLLLLLTPIFFGIVFQGWYNYERFGSLYKFIDYNYFYLNPQKMGGEFNIFRIKSSIANYFLPNLLSFTKEFPYIRMVTVTYDKPDLFFSWREQTIALPLVAPWIFFICLISLLSINNWGKARYYSILYILILGAMPISTFYFCTQRYSAEYLPLFTAISHFGYYNSSYHKKYSNKFYLNTIFLLVLFGSIVSIISTNHWKAFYAIGGVDIPQKHQDELRKAIGTPLPEISSSTEAVAVNFYTPISKKNGSKITQFNMQASSLPFEIMTQKFYTGIGMFGDSQLIYEKPEGTKSFEAYIGVNDSNLNCYAMSFVQRIKTENNQLLWESPIIVAEGANPIKNPKFKTASRPFKISVNIPVETKKIILESDSLYDGDECDFANWVDASFIIHYNSINYSRID